MNIKDIIKNGDATLDTNGDSANLNGGFMVAVPNHETVISLNDLKDFRQVEKTINEYKALARKNNGFVGCWVNDNKIYIDISKHYKQLKRAIKKGIEYKQLAIFDIGNLKDITL